MRIAAFVVVLVVHAVLIFLLLEARRRPTLRPAENAFVSTGFFVEPAPQAPAPRQPTSAGPEQARAPVKPSQRPPESTAITEPPSTAPPLPVAPDWRNELQIAANDQLAKRQHQPPSLLAPHDFSRVKPGSTDEHKSEFGWDHAATHRVEEIPTGGLLININDRCAVIWIVVPLFACKIGKIGSHGNLFDHLKDAPEPQP